MMSNPPLTPAVSQEVILLIERLKNGGNCAGLAKLRRYAGGGTCLGGKGFETQKHDPRILDE